MDVNEVLTTQNVLSLFGVLVSLLAFALGWWMARMQVQVDTLNKEQAASAVAFEAYKASAAVSFEAYKATVPTRGELEGWFQKTDDLLAKQDEKLSSLMQLFYEKLSSKQDKS